jgi:medium-chain acyl-[acyl-carrier-protein] hydrolase
VSTDTLWLRESRFAAPGLRMLCFPHAGAGAAAYLPWAAQLAPAVRLTVAQLPGREDRMREPPIRRMELLVDALVQVLRDVVEPPFAIFGHSMGALIGFEVARRLRQTGLPEPAWLIASGHAAPNTPDTRSHISHLPESEFISAAKKLNGFPEAILQIPELLKMVTPILRADFQLHESYRYLEGAPLDCPISVFGGTGDDVRTEDLARWEELTTASCSLRMLPGDHFFVNTAREELTRAIWADLSAMASPGRSDVLSKDNAGSFTRKASSL